jgi:cell shape-determining protein MreD
MAELLNYPILILILIIQMTIGRNVQLIGGAADFILLWLICWGLQKQGKNVWYGAIFSGLILSFASAIPWYASVFECLLAAGLSRFFSKRSWQNPLIALFIVTFISAVVSNFAVFVSLRISGSNLIWKTSLIHVIVPSVFLDLLLALPIYIIVHDMSRWVYKKRMSDE